KITALYSDGSTKDITSFTISPSTVKAAGNNTVTVTYSGKTTTVTVPGKAGVQADVEDTAVISIGSSQIWMTMTVDELTSSYGQPDEKLASFKSYTWYVYGTDDYADFFAVGIENKTVVAIYANSPAFSYEGVGFGDVCPISTDDSTSNKGVRSKAYTTLDKYTVTYYVDHNNTDSDGNALVHAVCIEKTSYIKNILYYSYTQSELDDGCRLNFHLLNAFRLCYGLNILEWCDTAADVAQAHSLDMATNDYVSHTSLDGRTMSERITNGGILWRRCGENIAAGSDTALFTHNGWVNSSGHRDNLIGEFERVGIGASYNEDSTYRVYWTQNFYTPR
ncbi:MAG TPA: CAP domain-containing protein, partial [Bacillota bacterium]|nr:CAP domain-containing protein [Bacillota bacterium]